RSWESSLVQKTRRSASISTNLTSLFGLRIVRMTPLETTQANSPLARGILLSWGRFPAPERGLILIWRGGTGPTGGTLGGGGGVTPDAFPGGTIGGPSEGGGDGPAELGGPGTAGPGGGGGPAEGGPSSWKLACVSPE